MNPPSESAADTRPNRTNPNVLKVAIPNKGRLSEQALNVLDRAGLRLDFSHERKLFATTRNGRIQVLFLRAADIPEFVSDGVAHLGVTGADIVAETGHDVEERADLGFGSCKLVVAVPDESPIKRPEDVPDDAMVATSFPNLTRAYFEGRNKSVKIIAVSGATEITPHIGVADLITDLTSTGSTMLMNGLRPIDTIMASSARLIAGPGVMDGPHGDEARKLIEAVDSVIAARKKRYLLADIPRSKVDEVRSFLPGIAGPTVVDVLGSKDIVAIHVVVDEDAIFDAVARLKGLGGRGILVMSIDRMVA